MYFMKWWDMGLEDQRVTERAAPSRRSRDANPCLICRGLFFSTVNKEPSLLSAGA